MRRDAGRGVHRQVDVRTPRECFAPPAHRTFCVQPLRLAESADRFRMIERVIQAQSLIEVSLRLRVRRGDGVRMRAEIRVEGNRLRGQSWISLPRILENRQHTSGSDYSQQDRKMPRFHRSPSSFIDLLSVSGPAILYVACLNAGVKVLAR